MNAVRQALYASLLVAILLIGLSETQPVYAARMEQQYVTSVLKLMEGDWYDTSGACILQIKGGYINGCQVLAAYDFAGSKPNGTGRFEILERTGPRNLYLTWDIRHSDKDSVKLNDRQMLHRTAKPSFNESVAGIHLGMTSGEVLAVLGSPTQAGNLSPYVNTYGWYYSDRRIAITFDADTVDRILLFKGSSAVLEHSGLNCENTPYEFAQAYHMKRVPVINYDTHYSSSGIYSIGADEYLAFGNRMDYIMLTKYMT